MLERFKWCDSMSPPYLTLLALVVLSSRDPGRYRERSVVKRRGTTRTVRRCGLLLAAVALAACHSSARDAPPDAPSFDFRKEDPHWSAGFADVPVGYEDGVQFVADHRPLPAPLVGNGLYQSGTNVSDDLCMWFARGVAGFEPGAEYALSFEVGIASDAGADCDAGIAAFTFVKVGASSYMPSRSELLGWWRMNVDKGMASGEGTQALTVGDIRNVIPGCPAVDPPWGERRLSSGGREIRARASADGTIWLFVLTDSGWESAYRVYFTYLDVKVRPV